VLIEWCSQLETCSQGKCDNNFGSVSPCRGSLKIAGEQKLSDRKLSYPMVNWSHRIVHRMHILEGCKSESKPRNMDFLYLWLQSTLALSKPTGRDWLRTEQNQWAIENPKELWAHDKSESTQGRWWNDNFKRKTLMTWLFPTPLAMVFSISHWKNKSLALSNQSFILRLYCPSQDIMDLFMTL
jgi:hypothetical protein